MRIALYQMNPTIGDMAGNHHKILQAAKKAKASGADLLVAPELSLCGYPPKDLIFRDDFMQEVDLYVQKLARETPLPTLFGAPQKRGEAAVGLTIYNSAILAQNGHARAIAHKTLLPNYDVFDERRYFEPSHLGSVNRVFELAGKIFGVTICEDAWNDEDFIEKRFYEQNPVQECLNEGAQVLINLSASPYSFKKPQFRQDLWQHLAKKHDVPVLMSGQVGANDQLVFDGGTLAVSQGGLSGYSAADFEEDLLIFDLDAGGQVKDCDGKRLAPKKLEPLLEKSLLTGIADYVEKCGAKGALIGLSGGIDSALVATLCQRALGKERVMGVYMPSQFSSQHSREDAESLAHNLGIKFQNLDIEPMVAQFRSQVYPLLADFGAARPVVDQNLQARVRGCSLMAISNQNDYLLMATGNKSELSVGYSTLYGDMCGAMAPIGDLYKTQVFELARFLNKNEKLIPERSITKAPSAELKPDQEDEDDLLPYHLLDPVLKGLIEKDEGQKALLKRGVSREDLAEITQKVRLSEYKRRQGPFCLKVTDRVFGEGRRYPMAQGFTGFGAG